jgi:hypothetical protein
MIRYLLFCCALWLLCPVALLAQPPKTVEFNRDIRPILSDYCYTCHGPAKSTRKADLRLDTKDGAFADLGGYKAVVPGSLKESKLWERITAKEASERMPPAKLGRKLNDRQIDLLRRWIEQGAAWQEHWAFISPKRPDLRKVNDPAWMHNPIDAFILARLDKEGIKPAPEASGETLIRRVTLDLTGMPPTLKEIDDFLKDTSPNAYEKVVDRLLASPRYGERMVLEWLDAARYSDTNGYQTDGTRAMWPWRDWVIDALNKNMPFDLFTIEQIAGDMLPSPTIRQKIATGFHRNHMLNGEGGRIAEESRVDYVVDRVDTTGAVWLGLTVGCGRCHDHKYDPISQKEYYRLFAYFNNIAEVGGVDRRSGTGAPVLELPTEEQKAKIAKIEKSVNEKQTKLNELEKTILVELKDKVIKIPDRTSPDYAKLLEGHPQNAELQKLQKALAAEKKALTDARNSTLITMIMEERKDPRETFVLVRGIYNKYGDKVQPGIPNAFPPLPKDAPNNRLGLARWLVSKDNPLTARVAVNRLWQQYFGLGLVKTAEDFGIQGDPPSHPDLLDWLAVELMQKWDMKALHKLIVMSSTYRQASKITPAAFERDPDNRMLSRGPRLRLSPFLLRDQALALSGLYVEKVGGPPVRPYQPPGLWEDFSFNQIKYVQDKGDKLYRRSLYTFWRRSIGPPNMFDTPNRQVCTVRQARTNTPLHALILMNDVTFVEASRVWAERLMKTEKTSTARLALAWRQATARSPSPAEQKVLEAGYQRVLKEYQTDPKAAEMLVSAGEWRRDKALDVAEHAALAAMANMILNLDEVITKE